MHPLITVHAFVSGKVQGVFYRDTVRRKAETLHITGWVKNLLDGRVELMATGSYTTMDAFIIWLWEGSKASKVTGVDWQQIEYKEFENFVILH